MKVPEKMLYDAVHRETSRQTRLLVALLLVFCATVLALTYALWETRRAVDEAREALRQRQEWMEQTEERLDAVEHAVGHVLPRVERTLDRIERRLDESALNSLNGET